MKCRGLKHKFDNNLYIVTFVQLYNDIIIISNNINYPLSGIIQILHQQREKGRGVGKCSKSPKERFGVKDGRKALTSLISYFNHPIRAQSAPPSNILSQYKIGSGGLQTNSLFFTFRDSLHPSEEFLLWLFPLSLLPFFLHLSSHQ